MYRSKNFSKYIPYLEKYLYHSNNQIRVWAVQALGFNADDKHVPIFLDLIRNDKKLRYTVCGSLFLFSEKYEEEMVDALIWVINKKNINDQWYAIDALRSWINPKATETLKWESKYNKWVECRKLARKILKRNKLV